MQSVSMGIWQLRRKMTDVEYLNLLDELQNLEGKGVAFDVDGEPASSVDVVHAHMVHENFSYMRDYIADKEGTIDKIKFNTIRY